MATNTKFPGGHFVQEDYNRRIMSMWDYVQGILSYKISRAFCPGIFSRAILSWGKVRRWKMEYRIMREQLFPKVS